LPTDRYVARCGCDTCPTLLKRRRGLSSRIAFGMAAFGITQPRYLELKCWLSLFPKCNRKKREVCLNRLGERMAHWFNRRRRIFELENPGRAQPTGPAE
jgi:hypothetical protein